MGRQRHQCIRPKQIELHAADLEVSQDFAGLPKPLRSEDLAFGILAAGVDWAGAGPVIFVNEPIFISDGANSDIRYNSFYPRRGL